ILHDPNSYLEPDSFMPERFLSQDGQIIDDPALSVVFGFGKRYAPYSDCDNPILAHWHRHP
ncbi:hypothetical protein BV25DRAFT_1811108, partial [Artomyces pyxidatus]